MATHKFDLEDGLKVGEAVHKAVVLREATAGDIIDATTEAERAVATPTGWQLLVSPSRMGVEVLRRQVVSIGEHPGPLAVVELRKLSAGDFDRLQAQASAFDGLVAQTAAKGVAERGRD